VSSTKNHRRAQRRAESRLFEAIEAADAGELRLAEDLLDRAAIPRRARRAVIGDERAAIRRSVQSGTACPRPTH
jgi:hypothetical protein